MFWVVCIFSPRPYLSDLSDDAFRANVSILLYRSSSYSGVMNGTSSACMVKAYWVDNVSSVGVVALKVVVRTRRQNSCLNRGEMDRY